MTKEALMKPRYKVIADYPCRPHPIGHILEFSGDHYDSQSLFRLPGSDHRYPEKKFKEYPHLFQSLQWWEDRELHELPEYVKCIKTPDQKIFPGMVIKVAWCSKTWGTDHVRSVILDTNCYEPADENDYTEWLKREGRDG